MVERLPETKSGVKILNILMKPARVLKGKITEIKRMVALAKIIRDLSKGR